MNREGALRGQTDWILTAIESGRAVVDHKDRSIGLERKPPEKIYCGQKVYPWYPVMLDIKPDIPSPHTTLHGAEIVTVFTRDGKFTLIPVTVENGKTLNYKQGLWGKGRQLKIDAADFPAMARTGLHAAAELDQTKMITGRSIVEIIEIGRPGRSSGAGFMSHDEDILSVLKGDNRLVREMLPYYIMRYGFYEGHTDYRADPIAIAWIFGLRSIRRIDAAFEGRLDEALTDHFTREEG